MRIRSRALSSSLSLGVAGLGASFSSFASVASVASIIEAKWVYTSAPKSSRVGGAGGESEAYDGFAPVRILGLTGMAFADEQADLLARSIVQLERRHVSLRVQFSHDPRARDLARSDVEIERGIEHVNPIAASDDVLHLSGVDLDDPRVA